MFKKVVIIDYGHDEIPERFFSSMTKLFGEYVRVKSDTPELLEELKDADAILSNYGTTVSKEMIDTAKNLRYIGVSSAAYTWIDREYAKSRDIVVSNAGPYSEEAVAEWMVAVIMSNVRNLHDAKKQADSGNYDFVTAKGVELLEKNLGIVGAGSIGSRVAEIGSGLGMKVSYFARSEKPRMKAINAERKELKDLLATSDVLPVTLALNDGTEGMLDKEMIMSIKKDSVLACVVQMQLFDLDALYNALQQNRFTFVYDQSDSISPEQAKKFNALESVDAYPHMAFSTYEAVNKRWTNVVDGMKGFLKGSPINIVN